MLSALFGPGYLRKMAGMLGLLPRSVEKWTYGAVPIGARSRARILAMVPTLRAEMMERQRQEREAFEAAAMELAMIHREKPSIYKKIADEWIKPK